ncbi:MAG: hypothetical protein ABI939_04315 [Anaerolineaceae bacterium]
MKFYGVVVRQHHHVGDEVVGVISFRVASMESHSGESVIELRVQDDEQQSAAFIVR